MAIHNGDFARHCVNQSLFYGVNPHFLLAVADSLSGIKDDTVQDTNGKSRIGPFRLLQSDWDSEMNDPLFEESLRPDDINEPMLQCIFAAVQTLHAQDELEKTLKRFPSADELYAKWPSDPAFPGTPLQASLNKTRALVQPAVEAALAGMDEGPVVGSIDLSLIPAGAKRDNAAAIINAFAAAGYAKVHQVAALANAMAESALNNNAVNNTPPEHSVGLFQLNINGGVGSHHTEAELKDPAKNINLIIQKAKTVPDFKAADDLHTAVAVFVRKIEQPANQAGEIIKRFAIARKFVPS